MTIRVCFKDKVIQADWEDWACSCGPDGAHHRHFDHLSDISEWVQDWFQDAIAATPSPDFDHLPGTALKVAEEAGELARAKTPEEALVELADVYITFRGCMQRMGVDDDQLMNAVLLKMFVNLERTWGPPDQNGVRHHVD